MANLFNLTSTAPSRISFEGLDTATFEIGDFVIIGGPNLVASAERGFLQPFVADVVGQIPVGIVQSVPLPVTQGITDKMVAVFAGETVIENAAIAGAAGDNTDVGKPVYASAKQTLTLTAPTTGQERIKVGYITKKQSAGFADVTVLGINGWAAIYNASDGEIPAAA